MAHTSNAKIVMIVKIKSALSEDEMLKIAKQREHEFKAIIGLVQKYYVKMKDPGIYGGVYIWDSMESLKKFRESELAATIPVAYQAIEPPHIEIMDLMFPLRD